MKLFKSMFVVLLLLSSFSLSLFSNQAELDYDYVNFLRDVVLLYGLESYDATSFEMLDDNYIEISELMLNAHKKDKALPSRIANMRKEYQALVDETIPLYVADMKVDLVRLREVAIGLKINLSAADLYDKAEAYYLAADNYAFNKNYKSALINFSKALGIYNDAHAFSMEQSAVATEYLYELEELAEQLEAQSK